MKYLTGHESLEDLHRLLAKGEQVCLPVSAVRVILQSALTKQLTNEAVQQIADVLECEGFLYEDVKSTIIATILFELSASEINGELMESRYSELINALESLGSSAK